VGTAATQSTQSNTQLGGKLLGPRRGHHPATGRRRGSRHRSRHGNNRSRWWGYGCWGSRRGGRRRWCWCSSWGRGNSRCSWSLGCHLGNLSLGFNDQANCFAHRCRTTGWHQHSSQVALVEGLHIHVGLIRLDDQHGLPALNLVAWLLEPLHDFALRHGGGEGRHENFVGGQRRSAV
jgi:hypothetical protein